MATNNAIPVQLEKIAEILLFQRKLQKSTSVSELGRILVNDIGKLVPNRTAVLWLKKGTSGKVEAISGIPEPVKSASFTVWVNRICAYMVDNLQEKYQVLHPDIFLEEIAADWKEYLPADVIWLPLVTSDSQITGGLLLARDTSWQAAELSLLEFLSEFIAHTIDYLKIRKVNLLDRFSNCRIRLWLVSLTILVLVLTIPVSISVLAPAEVVPKDPVIIRSRMDGVIDNLHVLPNQEVNKGDLLFDLDNTRLLARLDVARQELKIANAEYRQAEQAAVSDRKASSQLSILKSRIQQRETEVTYVKSLQDRISVTAEQKGIAIFNDAQELRGKPVKIGEKILVLAHPESPEIEFWLPVNESLQLPENAEVNLFLNVQPEKGFSATLRYINYQAEVNPEGILAFRGRADLNSMEGVPRIGWRGVARITGNRVSLFYYLFRRPYAASRQWLGI